MLRIRLRRIGKKGRPHYRVVVADQRAKRDGRFLENLGSYDPHAEPPIADLNMDSARQWMAKGAQPSESVEKIFRRVGIIEGGPIERPMKPSKAAPASAEAPAAPVAAAPAPAAEAAAEAEAAPVAEAEAAAAEATEVAEAVLGAAADAAPETVEAEAAGAAEDAEATTEPETSEDK